MAFIDELTIFAKAGKGGDGVVRWLREFGKPKGGPSGGDGGKGGNVVFEAVRDIHALAKLRFQKVFEAEDGEPGGNNNRHGGNGKDLTIQIPVGSVVKNQSTGFSFEFLKDGERVVALQGGLGGFGNTHFKSSTNRRPRESSPGLPGEEGELTVELQLVVDAGFVGYPNAGKSSLLNALTRAHAKVGSYAFTTLDPNLGDFHGFVLADIPGLIEGASEGKGLGHKFLKHIKRTKLILHCISFEREDLVSSYRAIRKELEAYPGLASKEEIILLTKGDLVEPEERAKKQAMIGETTGRKVFVVSAEDPSLLADFTSELSRILSKQD